MSFLWVKKKSDMILLFLYIRISNWIFGEKE